MAKNNGWRPTPKGDFTMKQICREELRDLTKEVILAMCKQESRASVKYIGPIGDEDKIKPKVIQKDSERYWRIAEDLYNAYGCSPGSESFMDYLYAETGVTHIVKA